MSSANPLVRAPSNDPAAGRAAPGTAAHGAVSTIHRVIGGTLALLSTQPITWAATLLLTVYTPRYLSGAELGELGIVTSASLLVGTLAMLGVPTVLTRTVARPGTNAAAETTVSLVTIVSLSVVGSVLAGALGLRSGLLAVSAPLLAVGLAGMVVMQVQTLLFAVLAGQQRLREYAWLNAGSGLVTALLSVAALMLGGGALGVAGAALVVTLLSVVLVWRRVGLGVDTSRLSWAGVRSLTGSGLPFLAWNLLLRIRGDVDALVLARLLSVEAVGWWNAGQRIVSIPVFVPTLVVTPLLPALSAIRDDRETFTRTLQRSFQLTVLVTIAVSAAIAGLAPLVPSLLGWSPEYVAAVPVIQLMAPMLPLVSISMVLGTGLIALGRERRWLLVNLIATSAQYVVLFVGIPATQAYLGNGTIGAALGRIVAECLMVAGAQVLLPRGMIGWGSWFFVARAAVVGVACVAAALPLAEQSLVLAGAAGVLVYAVGVLALRLVSPSELAAASQAVRGTLRRRVGLAEAA